MRETASEREIQCAREREIASERDSKCWQVSLTRGPYISVTLIPLTLVLSCCAPSLRHSFSLTQSLSLALAHSLYFLLLTLPLSHSFSTLSHPLSQPAPHSLLLVFLLLTLVFPSLSSFSLSPALSAPPHTHQWLSHTVSSSLSCILSLSHSLLLSVSLSALSVSLSLSLSLSLSVSVSLCLSLSLSPLSLLTR